MTGPTPANQTVVGSETDPDDPDADRIVVAFVSAGGVILGTYAISFGEAFSLCSDIAELGEKRAVRLGQFGAVN